MKKIVSLLLSVIMLISLCVSAFAANNVAAPAEFIDNSDVIFADEGKISLTPGEENGDVNFAWVVSEFPRVTEHFVYGKETDLSDGVEAKITAKTESAIVYIAYHVSLTDLEPGTYYYRYTYAGRWQNIASFKVQDDEAFSVLFVSDPQLGRSDDDSDAAILDDCYGWDRTLKAATAKNGNLSFALCAGDQVNMALSQKQYNAVLYPETLRSLPIATAVGNHDFYSYMYSMRFNNPNETDNDMFSTAGKGYYFVNGAVLFIVLNTNNYVAEDQRALIATAVNENPDVKWRVVMMHESPYFSGMDEEGSLTETNLPPIFDEFDIDLVLSGHEHVYSRTAPLTAGVSDENGVTYLAASTASGCSYDGYEVTDSRIVKNENCKEPSYSILDFSENEISVKSYLTDSGECFDEFSIEKETGASGTVDYEYTAWYMHVIQFFISLFGFLFK